MRSMGRSMRPVCACALCVCVRGRWQRAQQRWWDACSRPLLAPAAGCPPAIAHAPFLPPRHRRRPRSGRRWRGWARAPTATATATAWRRHPGGARRTPTGEIPFWCCWNPGICGGGEGQIAEGLLPLLQPRLLVVVWERTATAPATPACTLAGLASLHGGLPTYAAARALPRSPAGCAPISPTFWSCGEGPARSLRPLGRHQRP